MTMKELAKLAGVSPAAVSRYLNGGSLSAEKQEVIRRAIEKTGYQPDLAAQMLRTRTTDLVGIIVPKLDSESVSRLTAGAAEELSQEGYLCQIAVTQNDPERELSYLSLCQNRSLAGAILMSTTADARHESFLKKLSIPVVVVGQRMKNVSCIYHDDFGAARELTRLILARGRTRLAMISATEQDPAAGLARQAGVRAAMEEAGLDPGALPVEISSFDIAGGAAAMERLLRRAPGLDGVLCATDRMAFGAMETLRSAGLVPGRDVSIAGLGDSWAGRHVVPHLTTAHLYYKTSGRAAARLLMEKMRIRKQDDPVRQTMLSYSICPRDSV